MELAQWAFDVVFWKMTLCNSTAFLLFDTTDLVQMWFIRILQLGCIRMNSYSCGGFKWMSLTLLQRSGKFLWTLSVVIRCFETSDFDNIASQMPIPRWRWYIGISLAYSHLFGMGGGGNIPKCTNRKRIN